MISVKPVMNVEHNVAHRFEFTKLFGARRAVRGVDSDHLFATIAFKRFDQF
jgi:hypothetical protein